MSTRSRRGFLMLRFRVSTLGLTAALVGVALISTPAKADVEDRIYDFTDAFYLANGVNLANIGGCPPGVLPNSTVPPPLHPWQRNVRMLRTSGSFGSSGNLQYFHVMGGGDATLFTA